MKPIVRHLAALVVAVAATLVGAATVANAQPAGSAATGSAATGSAATGSGSAAGPAAGSGTASAVEVANPDNPAAPPITPVVKNADGSGSAAGSASGSGSAAAAGSGTGSGSGSGAAGAAASIPWYVQLEQKPVEEDGTFWMPKAVNEVALDSDGMFYAVLGLSAFFFLAIAIAVIYLVIKYRHRPGHKAEPSAAHNDALEVTWTVIPTIICVFLFYYGWRGYVEVVTPPTAAVEIQVLAQRWQWNFTHENGVQDGNLHVPVNTPVRMVMTSKDVLHSFYIPVMRIKQDIVPGRYTYAWFKAMRPGTYRLDCAEYCGTNHSQMGIDAEGRRAVVVVHEPGGYERYLADKSAESSNMPPEQLGKMLYEKKGCVQCHTVDGSAKIGPTWLHDFGSTVPLNDGSSVKMDENYIRESIDYPQAKSRPGYPPSMPSFQGQLKEKDYQGIIAYFKSLK